MQHTQTRHRFPENFLLLFEQGDPSECWIWQHRTHRQYGVFQGRRAHRVSYELFVGPIPKGLELDHLCCNTLCVNPAHLEPVTRAENMRRRYEAYTECSKGHPYIPENTYIRPDGHRDCRQCIRDRSRKHYYSKA